MKRNQALFQKARRLMPGGVNSPVRNFSAVGETPFFVKKAKGPYLWDEEGKRYLDYVLSWGPLLLGHAHPAVVRALTKSIKNGTSFGACHAGEIRLAELIRHFVPSLEKIRLVSSGTEAVMSAVRLARAFTGREAIVKFEGCYHGHGDSFLVKAGSGAATFGKPSSAGVPQALARLTHTLAFNDSEAVKALFRKRGRQIACIVVEPVAGNMGVVPPGPAFLETLRAVTKKCGSLLIFDEVMTGFRVSLGGAQGFFKIKPDLTCLGKVIGGGMPLAAYGGRREIMDRVAPLGPVYQGGTLSGNPAAVAAGIATLEILKDQPGHFKRAETRAATLEKGIRRLIQKYQLGWTFQRAGTLWTLFFTDRASQGVRNFRDVQRTDRRTFSKFFRHLLKENIFITPSAFEANFLSSAHSAAHIRKTLKAVENFIHLH